MTWSWTSFGAGAAAMLSLEALAFALYMFRTARRNAVPLTLLACLVVSGCVPHTSDPTPGIPTCQILVPYGGSIIRWTCTSGGSDSSTGRPDHAACVLCPSEPLWTPTTGGTCVPSCSVCTPAIIIAQDPTARCTPNASGEEGTDDMGSLDLGTDFRD